MSSSCLPRKLLALGLLGLFGCSDAPAPRPGRTYRTVLAEPIWSTGTMALFDSVEVSSVIALDSTVVVLLSDEARLVGLSLDDGRLSWRTGRKGGGPGEFELPRTLFAVSATRFGVLDSFGRRASLFDADGQFVHALAGPIYDKEIDDICAESDSTFVAARFPMGELVRANLRGEVIAARPMHWPDARLDAALHLKQARFARNRSASSVCVLHTVRGNYFTMLDIGRLEPVNIHEYLEHIVVPEVTTRNGAVSLSADVISGLSAVVDDSLVYVLFGGSSPKSEQQVDVYARETGVYRWSIALPRRATSIDLARGRLVVLESGVENIRQVSVYDLGPLDHGSSIPSATIAR